MPAYAGHSASRPGDVAGTLRLMAYLALAIALIVLDHRGGWLAQARARSELVMQPLWWVAGLPGRIGQGVREGAATRSQLQEENRVLRNALLVSGARVARLQVAAAENARLRDLLGASRRGGLDVQLAPILDIDLDPTHQRLVLDAGTRDGVRVGQSVIDGGGMLGQITQTTPTTATVLLVTDPDHALPVMVARTGVRLIAYGKGRSDVLALANIPLSSDVRVGDAIVTSGLGGRFPAGFPVGTVTALRPDDSRAFLIGDVRPAARLDRGRDVLLLRERRESGMGNGEPQARKQSPAPAHASVDEVTGNSRAADAAARDAPPSSDSPSARDPGTGNRESKRQQAPSPDRASPDRASSGTGTKRSAAAVAGGQAPNRVRDSRLPIPDSRPTQGSRP